MRLAILALISATACWAQCPVTLTPSSAHYGVSGGVGTFAIAATTCAHQPVSDSDWLTISFGQGSTTAATSVGYTVVANTLGAVRTGHINVLGSAFTVTQDAAACTYSVSPTAASVATGGGGGSFALTTNCAWSAASSASWLTVTSPSGTGNFTVAYTAAANTTTVTRTASIAIGTISFAVSQAGVGCSFSLDTPTFAFTAAGGSGKVSLTTDAACAWTIANGVSWITGLPAGGTGPGAINFSVAANTATTARNATILIAGQQVAVSQAAQGIVFSSASVTNAASFTAGAVAPGEIITVFGAGLGSATGVAFDLPVSTTLGGTQVLFDGLASPMIYSSASQLSAIVPYSLAGAVSTQMQIVFQGVKSAAIAMPVALSAPAIFTVPSKGTGPGAILNQDYSVNSAANPAARGSVIQIFATGGGPLAVSVPDGSISASAGKTFLDVTAQIGNLDSNVLYAGSAPGLISGVLQVNVLVPMGVTPGFSVPLTIQAGTNASLNGVTVAIQ